MSLESCQTEELPVGKITAAHLLVRTLKRHGIDRIFGLCGDHVNSIFNACIDEGVTIVDTRQESAAAHMADGWARVTGQPGVSVVTGGPGHTNSVTGITTAWMAGSPIITISGMHELSLLDKGPLQEIDQVGMVKPVTKWARLVSDPARLPHYIAMAYREAVSGRPGPVHLTIPVEVSDATVDDTLDQIPEPVRRELPSAPPGAIEAALDRLRMAERPVVIAGSGIWWAQAWESLRRFVELTNLPCFTISMARGALSDEHPLCLGYADQILNPVARQIREADVVLLIGKRIDFRLAYGNLFGPDAQLIQVDIHAPELGKNRAAQIPIQGDAGAVLDRLVEGALRQSNWKEKPWVERLRQSRKAPDARQKDENSDGTPIHPLRLVKEIREAVSPEVVWIIDGGDFAQFCRLGLPARKPGHWVRLGPLGTVGAAIPFGIAAKLAKPDAPVVVLTGDGGMAFHSWEIHTALRFNVPIVVVVGNDCGWGMERELQSAFYDRTIGVELGRLRYDKVIEAMGGHGEHVERAEELRPALERALRAGKAACVNVMIRGVASPFTLANIARAKKN
jgi:acetolactate synthase-1/2/3 large subunit